MESITQTNEAFDPEIQSFFQECSKKLDATHDRHERLVKLSRDITIESKVNQFSTSIILASSFNLSLSLFQRVIFLLHRIQDDGESKIRVTDEAESKLEWVVNNLWNRLASELVGQDPHHFLRAYSPGTITTYFYLTAS